MELILREMEAGEAKAVQALGIKCFLRSLEGFYVVRPKTALVAEKGELAARFAAKESRICGRRLRLLGNHCTGRQRGVMAGF